MTEESKIVRFNNKMNELNLKDFNEKDLNFLMAIFSKIRNQGDEKIYISYDEIKKAVDWRNRDGNNYFNNTIQHLSEKGRTLGGTLKNGNNFISGNVFSCFIGRNEEEVLQVKLNSECLFMLNEIIDNFTEFELKNYLKLKGIYPKSLFQHLCQYRSQGWWYVTQEDLVYYLNIPKSMKPYKYSYAVINPAITEISKYDLFENLKCEQIKEGRKIAAYKFTWKAEKKKRDSKNKNSFTNFNQTSYQQLDFEEFEKSILAN